MGFRNCTSCVGASAEAAPIRGAFLISRAPADSDAARRLDVIQGTLDGAEIAQADLEFRGAGDVLGDAQSGGKSGLKLLRVVKDVRLTWSMRGLRLRGLSLRILIYSNMCSWPGRCLISRAA